MSGTVCKLVNGTKSAVSNGRKKFGSTRPRWADHDGEAPEACSYCRGIVEARTFLAEAGGDVSALTPAE